MGATQQVLVAVSAAGGLPLDAYTTDLIGAWSRSERLLTAWAGSAFRVRRTSDNAEQDIGFSGNLVDTAAMASFGGANSLVVTTVYDQSGNGNHKIQATTTAQPPIYTSGVDLGHLAYDGTNAATWKYMRTTNNFPSGKAVLSTLQKCSIVTSATGTLGIINELGNNANNFEGFYFYFMDNVGSDTLQCGVTSNPSLSRVNSYTSASLAVQVRAHVADRLAVAAVDRNLLYEDGVFHIATSTDTASADTTAGDFSQQPIYFGARGSGPALGGKLRWHQGAIWASKLTAGQVAAISTAIA
jgi:hypothetical protein